MPRAVAKKANAVAAMEVEVPTVQEKRVRKGKRPAEDPPEEKETVPTKAPRTAVLGKSKQPTATNEVSSETKAAVTSKKAKVETSSAPVKSKKAAAKISPTPLPVVGATLHCFGTNDCGQLGFQCQKRKYPALVPSLEKKKIIAVACGGMHTIALEEGGTVWTFGLNDDKALGRVTEEEEDAFEPGKVDLPKKVIQISAGDSHSAALTEDGEVYAWGCFKDDNGNFGLVADDGEICREQPENITSQLGLKIVKIASGAHHIAMLTDDGQVATCGTGEQGQLGRQQPEYKRVTRSMGGVTGSPVSRRQHLLLPAVVKITRNPKMNNVWAGEFSTYCSTDKSNDIYVCGLNNYGQLGIKAKSDDQKNIVKIPTKTTSFKGKKWKQIAAGQHHVVALDQDGKVYTLGRNTDGRLGIGKTDPEKDKFDQPTVVEGLADKKCIAVAAGGSTSYAVTEDGHLYSWGFGENFQLASGDDEDRDEPTRCFGKPNTNIEGRVVDVSAGGQHVALTISLPKLTNGEQSTGPKVNGKD